MFFAVVYSAVYEHKKFNILFLTALEADNTTTDRPQLNCSCSKIPWETDWNGKDCLQGEIRRRGSKHNEIDGTKTRPHSKIQRKAG